MKVPEPLQTVARNLGDLCDKVVFVGGMIRSLLVSDPAAGAARPTDDVDLIVELPDRVAHVKLGAELRARGFSEASLSGAEDRVIHMPLMGEMYFEASGLEFLRDWALPLLPHRHRLRRPPPSRRCHRQAGLLEACWPAHPEACPVAAG
jgi:hypothetical protein